MKEQSTINTFKTIKDLEAYRKQINEMCDERKKFITLCEEANELSNKPFEKLLMNMLLNVIY